jgi:hypothetical protein
VFTLRVTVRGRQSVPTKHESIADLGDALTEALSDAGMGLEPRAITTMLTLMSHDLCGFLTWTWVAEGYEIFVAQGDP